MSPVDLPRKVDDRDSFIEFVRFLAGEEEESRRIIGNAPPGERFTGALGWQNGTISSFLYAALDYFETKPFHKPEETPSWRMLADFLYCGKIIE